MKYLYALIIFILSINFVYAQKEVWNDDFENGQLNPAWTISEKSTQELQSNIVYKAFQAKSYALCGHAEERCLISHNLNSKDLENMVLSDKFSVSFAYYVTKADYVSCEIHTDKGDYQKTFAPITPNTWQEVTISAKDFLSTSNQGDITGKYIKGGISFSAFGEGDYIIDNVKIISLKAINIESDKTFIPIHGKGNFAKIAVTVSDEYGKPIKDNTQIKLSSTGGTFDIPTANSKDGKANFTFYPNTQTGIFDITATVDKDSSSVPILVVPGIDIISWDFPTSSQEALKEYQTKLPQSTKIIKFRGTGTGKVTVKGNPYYIYINGKLTEAKVQKAKDSYITIFDSDGTNIYTLIPQNQFTDTVQILGINDIKSLISSTKEIWEESQDFLTDLKGTEIKGEYADYNPQNNISVTSVIANEYFVKQGDSFVITGEVKNQGYETLDNISVILTDKDKNIIDTKEIQSINPEETQKIDFTVTPKELGYKSYYIIADNKGIISETDKEDNIAPLLMDVLTYQEKSPTLTVKNLKATETEGKINITCDLNEFGEAYITLKKDNALYYVHNFTATENINETFTLPNNLPKGIYTVEVGVYEKAPTEKVSAEIKINTSTNSPLKPMSYGTFIDMEKVPHFWYVNHANMLMWQGKPYLTCGYMFVGTNFRPFGNSTTPVNLYDATLEEILVMQGVNACGITDMENTAKIKPFMQQAGMTYSAFAGEGNVIYWMKYPLTSYLIKNGKYFIDLTDGKAEYTFTDLRGEAIKGATYMIFDTTDEKPVKWERISLANSPKINIELSDYIPSHSYRAYITMELEGGHTIHDYWTAWEDRLSFAKEAIEKQKYPSGVRYAIDPFENEEGFFFNNDPYKIPNSEAYLKTFEEYLTDKYKSISDLCKAWEVIDGDISDFNIASHLTPIQIINDKSYVYDNINNKIITLNAKRSLYWYDTLDGRDTSLLNLHNKYADWFKQYCDVPIVSKRVGGHSKAFTSNTLYGGFDGVAVDCYNLSTKINKVTGSFLGDIEDSAKTGWFPTLEINYETPSTTKPTEGWPDETLMREDFSRFLEMGVKGFNIFALDLRNTAADVFSWPKFDVMLHPYQIPWYNNIKQDMMNNLETITELKPKVAYLYPTCEPELNSFVYGDKSHDGLGWSAVKNSSGYWFIPTYNFNHNNLVACSLPDYPVSGVYGEKLNNAIENKTAPIIYIGLRKDLGQIPQLDKYFEDKFITVNTDFGQVTCQSLKVTDGFKPTHEENGIVYGMERDGLTIIAMDVNPTLYLEKCSVPIIDSVKTNVYEDILGVKDSTVVSETIPNEADFTLPEDKDYIYLSELTPTYAVQGWGVLETDHNLEMGPLSSKGIKFKHGLASHAPAEIIYNLEGKYNKFACFLGICDVYTDLGSVTYDIYADGKNIYSSGLVKGADYPRKLELDINGVNELKFIIGDGGDSNHADHASLFEARLYK